MTASMLNAAASVPMQGPIVGVFVRPMEHELGWSTVSISIGFALGSGVGGISSIWVGRVLDRRGARGVTVTAGVILVGCMVGLAAMTQVWHFWGLFGLARGTAAAGAQLGTMVALASWFVKKRGRVVGLLGVRTADRPVAHAPPDSGGHGRGWAGGKRGLCSQGSRSWRSCCRARRTCAAGRRTMGCCRTASSPRSMYAPARRRRRQARSCGVWQKRGGR